MKIHCNVVSYINFKMHTDPYTLSLSKQNKIMVMELIFDRMCLSVINAL